MEKVIKYRLSNLQTFIISFFLIIIGCSITRYTSLETAWLFLLGGLFLAFISLLESKRLSRVEKGVSLIFFGVFMGLGIPELFQKNYKDLITPDFKENLSIFTQIAYYVCAGAGGGVLANHAENIKTVDATPNIHNGSVDTALNYIKALQVEAISQRKKNRAVTVSYNSSCRPRFGKPYRNHFKVEQDAIELFNNYDTVVS
ncbi:hypothetical protein [Enterobacter ludwigii]|uniref:hypothetical protein n=1 Tax=Enterobacter ludwigii TaxID=299767 RepID=UPI0013D7F8EF|nr:hypothetical protein [Enterobacter ludwigii]